MTPEERVDFILLMLKTHPDSKLRGLIMDAIRASIVEEREACQKTVCYGCHHNLPYVNGMHETRDGLVPKGEQSRWVNCEALAIRARE